MIEKFDIDICKTCTGDSKTCPGHCGHIEIPFPVYNPIFYSEIMKLLSLICVKCYKVQISGKYEHLSLTLIFIIYSRSSPCQIT